ncbi:MAG: PAS domain-containing protein [Chloroflexi bacterium]|nr:PAS domain-containing protein [Chloroflexota bacterium]
MPMNQLATPPSIQLQSLLDLLVDGVIFSDPDGLIVYANEAVIHLTGMPLADILGCPITDILTRLPLLAAIDNMAKAAEFELNGRYIQGRATTVYTEDGEPQGILTTLRDITSEVEAEQAKNSFLETVSHELRAPLTAIKGYVELLAVGVDRTLNDNQKMLTTTIQRNVKQMVQLINSLIFASSIKNGRLEYISGHTDFSQLIPQISRELQPKAAEDGQQIRVNVDKNLQPLEVDPIHMAMILEELITNSIKFNRPRGKVWVTAVPETSAGDRQTFAVVSVRDEGIGIEHADQTYIFEEFFRSERTDAPICAQGTGVGLSIVRALVEAYNGLIWFNSIPNQGSSFTFIIPNQPPDPLAPPLTGRQ